MTAVDSPHQDRPAKEPQDRRGNIGTSSIHWFARGLGCGVLMIAAINAVSYFFLTGAINDLIGGPPAFEEAIGVPFEVWREGQSYNQSPLDYLAAIKNLAFGLVGGVLFGVIGVRFRQPFNGWVAEFEQKNAAAKSISSQFTLKSIMFWTMVMALLIALMTRWSGTSACLAAIYFLGPATLIGIAMFPNQLHWVVRAVIVTVLSLTVIGIAIQTGIKLVMPLDRVMLGFFVCWVPQSVFAAFFLTLGLVAKAIAIERTKGT